MLGIASHHHLQYNESDSNAINQSIEDDIEQHQQQEQDLPETIDELSPDERQRLARSRISQMFIKRQQQHKNESNIGLVHSASLDSAASNTSNGFMLNPDYVRVYENVDHYGHYTTNTSHNTDSKIETNLDEQDESNSNHIPNHNDDHRHETYVSPREQLATTATPSEDVPTTKPEVVPRRRTQMIGNPMLIDELKKRQSTLYQSID